MDIDKGNLITPRQVNKILAQANQIKFDGILPDFIYNILSIQAQSAGTSVEFLIGPLMSTLGVLQNQSTVQIFEANQKGICVYTALIALPFTSKSCAQELVERSLYKLETHLDMQPEKSFIYNWNVKEGLIEKLNHFSCVIGFHKETNYFITNTYKRTKSGKNEQALYSTLYSALDSFEHDTITKRYKIIAPRVHISVVGHPSVFINSLKTDKINNDDGLLQRFLMNAPNAPNVSLIKQKPKSIMALHCIFLFIHMAHFEKKRNYTFTNDALKLIDAEFDKNRQRVQIANEFDSFLGALIGKTITQMVRIAMMLQSLNIACNAIQDCPNASEPDITDDFAKECLIRVNKLTAEAFIIDIDITNRAKAMIEYFNLNKLVLSSYNVDPNGSFDEAFSKICESRPKQTFVSVCLATISSKILRYMKKAMTIELDSFNAQLLSSGNLSVAEADQVFDNLEQMQLGESKFHKSRNNHNVRVFRRVSNYDIKSNPSIGEAIQDLGLNLQTVIDTIQNSTNNLDDKLTNNKRPRYIEFNDSNDSSPPPKRPKYISKVVNGQVRKRHDNNLPYVYNSQSKPHNQVKTVESLHDSPMYPLTQIEPNQEKDEQLYNLDTSFNLDQAPYSGPRTSKSPVLELSQHESYSSDENSEEASEKTELFESFNDSNSKKTNNKSVKKIISKEKDEKITISTAQDANQIIKLKHNNKSKSDNVKQKVKPTNTTKATNKLNQLNQFSYESESENSPHIKKNKDALKIKEQETKNAKCVMKPDEIDSDAANSNLVDQEDVVPTKRTRGRPQKLKKAHTRSIKQRPTRCKHEALVANQNQYHSRLDLIK